MAQQDTANQHGIISTFAVLDAAWNGNDADGVASLFTTDCVLVSPYGEVFNGRDAVYRSFQELFQGRLKDSQRRTSITDVRELSPDTIMFNGAILFSGGLTPSGTPFKSDHTGVLTGVARNVGGQWEVLTAQVTPRARA